MKRVALLLAVVAACSPSRRNSGGGPCTDGQIQCDGNTLQTCQNGQLTDSMQCANICDDNLGCVLCEPGTGTCTGNVSQTCNADGMGYTNYECDALEGVTCGASGVCEGVCAPQTLGSSYIGCEYYATVTGNIVDTEFDFAVALANTSAASATVTIDGGALTSPQTITVPPGTLTVQKLPWQLQLKLCSDAVPVGACSTPLTSVDVPAGAYHIRSTQPITIYQFNSLEYVLPDGTYSYTNDASLLSPTNVWRTNYYAAAWQGENLQGDMLPSELAITATEANTAVTIHTTADTVAGPGVTAMTAGASQTVTLGSGEVLELISNDGDFTGTQVTSTNPVQVIGGTYCSNVPDSITACDHLEEAMFGLDALGENYIVNAPAVTTILSGKVEVVRIVATAPNTTLTYDPPQPGAPTTIAAAGDFVEIDDNAASFHVSASAKILVAQYMEGEDAGGGTGDPAMTLAVPVEQFRSSYMFQAPTSYETNYVDVTAPMGANVTLDGGTPLTFTPIGSSGYGLARVEPLGNGPAGDGNHTINGDLAFGISVYGYGQYTSYWYPGGLNLNTIVIQ